MKKLRLSLFAILALGTASIADSSNPTPILNEFYIGGAYGILGASYQEDFAEMSMKYLRMKIILKGCYK
ncbi:MAG: hypothetical protein Q9M36_11605 [Sulfurovum sp.]|nr:hypothetical protein [Sulfurovum sp.]